MIGTVEWMDRGMCVAFGAARWDTLSVQRQQIICDGCPVLGECRAWIMQQEQAPRHGVYAGLSPQQRRELAEIGER